MCSLEVNNSFSAAIDGGCRDGFDFTVLFEQTILGLVPAVAFLLSSPFRYKVLVQREVRTRPHIMRLVKLMAALVLATIQLALLISWAKEVRPYKKFPVVLSAVNLAVAMEMTVLTWVEDERSVRPSTLLVIYLVFTLLLDTVQMRTLWLYYGDTLLPMLFTASITAKIVMVLFESWGKQNHLIGSYQNLSPESTSGIVNRSFMWWLNRFFFKGFRSSITIDDLDHLDKPLESAETARKALGTWARRQHPERRFEFPWQMCRVFKGPLALTILPRLFMIGFTFSQPFLIASILNWLDNSHRESSEGYGLVGATLLIYVGMALSNLIYDQSLCPFVTMFRGAASSMIYDHALHIPDGTLEDRSAIITLMTTDIDRIISCLVMLNESWARMIEVGIGIALLALRLGWICLMPLVIILISSRGTVFISKHIGGHQKIWVDAVQQRIAITRSMLGNIHTAKGGGLSQTFMRLVQGKRDHETHQMANYRWSVVWKNMIQNLPWALAPALTFIAYAAQGNELNVTTVFSSLSIITLLTSPASKLLSAIPSIAAATGSFDRIQAFLLLAPGSKHRRGGLDHTSETGVDASLHSDHVQYMTFKDLPDIADSQAPAVSMDGVNIRPSPSAKVVLRDINLKIPLGALVIIQGSVGSGKSTLLRALLGQAICESGSTTMTIRGLAFCAQKPWIPSGTIRDAICGALSGGVKEGAFDKSWYATILHACALNIDLDLLREGDATRIGHGSGHMLSGGQMHRIALARAVYSRRKLLLLDDIFSSLDRETKTTIIARLFGADGLLRKSNSTVVLVAHEVQQLPCADQMYVLEDGHLRPQEPYGGTAYKEMLSDAADAEGSSRFPGLAIEDKATMISTANKIDDLRRVAGDSAVYMYYLRHVGWTNAVIFVFFVTMNVFSSTYSQIWLEQWADHAGARKALYVTVYFLLAVCNTVGNGGYVWAILILISPSTARRLHHVVLNTITMVCEYLKLLLMNPDLFSSIASATLIATGSTYMVISVPFLIATVFLLQHFYLKTSRQLRLLELESRSPLYSHLLDTVEGLATIQAFGWEESFQMANSTLLDVTQRTYYMLNCIQRWLTLVLDLIVAAEAVTVVSLAVSLRHATSVGLLGISLNSILGILSSLISGWAQLEISLGSIFHVKDFEQTVPREISAGYQEIPVDWPTQGGIDISRVTAQYSPGTTVLSNVSLRCLPGQKIGIYGRTGSGKSSLLSTLLGMLTVTDGSIVIDGIDLATLPPDIARERLVTVPQTPLIMVGCTVRLNLDPTKTLPDTDIITALIRVGLWDGVLLERGGLDAEISDTLSLSRGEQQLLQLARAMLKVQANNARILMIDEGTSSVDLKTDDRVQELLQQDPFRSCTVLTVAHRVHTLLSYDLVIGLDQGRVVETGEPMVMSDREGSIFSTLLNSWGK
ncbi:P-loop containing nucleoside triphosphate hydrolase protein [Aspergillus avenaceus]|uniref:P-loop containing nucleoside triphosphate hydrolase protein n=1 Tax=Aspergillus avenaceus TaxID=36643 RepID=A0A5N6TU73_ASPAV|nr:P-loop containing nucleoside triphosphate hydrolase protein [Aspergillus avenaceus]